MKHFSLMADLHLMEEQAYMNSNAIDVALEQFFSNVLECIETSEEDNSILEGLH